MGGGQPDYPPGVTGREPYLNDAGDEDEDMDLGMVHELKIWPEYFVKVAQGVKTFEVRKEDDRIYSVGDVLKLKEWDQNEKIFTGREIEVEVSYLLRGPGWGIEKGTVVLAIKRLAAQRD